VSRSASRPERVRGRRRGDFLAVASEHQRIVEALYAQTTERPEWLSEYWREDFSKESYGALELQVELADGHRRRQSIRTQSKRCWSS
jgi:hypothetical protein